MSTALLDPGARLAIMEAPLIITPLSSYISSPKSFLLDKLPSIRLKTLTGLSVDARFGICSSMTRISFQLLSSQLTRYTSRYSSRRAELCLLQLLFNKLLHTQKLVRACREFFWRKSSNAQVWNSGLLFRKLCHWSRGSWTFIDIGWIYFLCLGGWWFWWWR